MKPDANRKRRHAPQRRSSRSQAKPPRGLHDLRKSELVALAMRLQEQIAAAAAVAPVLPPPEPEAAPVAAAKTLIVDGSVRSGQTISFPDGDVTVIGSVGSGAEIVAGGSIHVYGTLRGRAIAGADGDGSARIFCLDLDAELLSIDGRYRVAENFDAALRGRPVQARLEGARMTLVPLDNGEVAPPATSEAVVPIDRFRRAGSRMRRLIGLSAASAAEASA